MRVATFNAHDSARAVRRSLELAGLLLWQEYPVKRPGQAPWLPDTHGMAKGPVGTNVATGWRLRWWDHLGSEWHQAHDGRRRVTPPRGELVTKLGHRRSQLGAAIVNGHKINRTRGAWLRVPGIHARWRAERWAEHAELERQLVAELVAEGWLVIGGGDTNRRHAPLPHRDAFYLAGHDSIDKLWAVDPSGVLQLLDDGVVDKLGSDHPLRWAAVKLGLRHHG